MIPAACLCYLCSRNFGVGFILVVCFAENQIVHADKSFRRHGEAEPVAVNQVADRREPVQLPLGTHVIFKCVFILFVQPCKKALFI